MKTSKKIIITFFVLLFASVNIFSETEQVFYDDFETSKGWVRNAYCSDNATTGLWERGDPEETVYNVTMQKGTTITGTNCLVTGRLAGSYAGEYDVDYGKTTVRSPAIVLPSDENITLSFYYTFAHYNNATNADYLRMKVVGNTTVTVFEVLGSATVAGGEWKAASASLNNFSGQTIYLLIEVADDAEASLIEAAIEDIEIVKGTECRPYPACYAGELWVSRAADIRNTNSGGVCVGGAQCTPGIKFEVDGKSRFNGNVGIGKAPIGLANLELPNNILLGDKSINQFTEINATSFQVKSGSDELLFVEGALAFKNGVNATVIYPTDIQTTKIVANDLETNTIKTRVGTDIKVNSVLIGFDDDLPNFARIRPTTGSGLAITGNNDDIGLFVSSAPGAKVGIGTTNTGSYKLAVNGVIGTKEIVVTQLGWSDHVFSKNYDLKSLSEIEDFIKKNHRLPGIPSEKEVKENGVSIGQMQAKLLEKIEEMTLYLIKIEKENSELKGKISDLEKIIK